MRDREIDSVRAHTGRTRNQAARQAIVDAAVSLLAERGPTVSIDAIAAAAGAGKQTIYRWWPSRGALLLEAMRERAKVDVAAPDTGSLVSDLTRFLRDTFRSARDPQVATLLRAAMRDALADTAAAESFAEFTAARRDALREVFARAVERGEVATPAHLDLLIDQAFGLLWYRLLLQHAPLTSRGASDLAIGLAAQATSV